MTPIKEICNSKNISELVDIYGKAVCGLGISKFAYLFVDKNKSEKSDFFYISTYPDKWAAHYVGKQYQKIDPVFKKLNSADEPFIWSNIWQEAPLSSAQKDFFCEAAEYKLSEGFGVPIISNTFGCATVSLASEENEHDINHIFSNSIDKLSLYSVYFHYTALSLGNRLRFISQDHENFKLTKRETDIVKWCAENKTFYEISVILGISYNTVLFHIKNIYRKMNVYSRQEMIVKAMLSGLVSY